MASEVLGGCSELGAAPVAWHRGLVHRTTLPADSGHGADGAPLHLEDKRTFSICEPPGGAGEKEEGRHALFQHSGSYSKVAKRGRWSTGKAMRIYVNQALADFATDSASIAWAGKLGLPKLLHLLST